jgi:hypothetical protein
MKGKLLVVMVGMVCAMAMSAQGAMVNWYKFEGNLSDSGGGSTATTLTEPANPVPISYVADPLAQRAGLVASFSNSGTAADFPASDPDIALGEDFTVEMWIYSTNFATTTTQPFLTANNYSLGLVSNHNWGAGTIQVTVDGGSSSAGPRYATGAWKHLALVVRSDGTFDHYIDAGTGTERIIGGTFTAGTMGTTTSLRLFTPSGGYGGATLCWLDDVAMFDSALTYAEVCAHGAAGAPPEPATAALLVIGSTALWLRRRRR